METTPTEEKNENLALGNDKVQTNSFALEKEILHYEKLIHSLNNGLLIIFCCLSLIFILLLGSRAFLFPASELSLLRLGVQYSFFFFGVIVLSLSSKGFALLLRLLLKIYQQLKIQNKNS